MDFLALGPNNFYLLNHHLLNRFFDILDLLPLVAINQHDLTQEQTFHSYRISFTILNIQQEAGWSSTVHSSIANDDKLLSE